MISNSKKTILHVIQNFGLGGAETAVVGVLKNLKEYNNIVVTLDGLNQFGDELKYDKYYNLNLKSYYLFPLAINKLRKIIIDNKVDIVHSQLYWSTILARFATPKHIPLVTSIQASLTGSVEYQKSWICQLEKYSYRRRPSVIIGVSKYTLNDYFDFLQLPRHQNYVLYNFVDTSIFHGRKSNVQQKNSNEFRLVTVGNLKPQKNQQFLLDAFKLLKGKPVSLDIYGDGILHDSFQQYIKENGINVRLMGKTRNLPELIQQYDLFVMSSHYEGFSLAVLEGMVQELPMLLSDIPTFTEQCQESAEYFPLNDPSVFVNKVLQLQADPARLKEMASTGRQRVLQFYTLEHHLAELRKIYAATLAANA